MRYAWNNMYDFAILHCYYKHALVESEDVQKYLSLHGTGGGGTAQFSNS